MLEDDSDTCMMFNYFRTSQDCSNYQPAAIGILHLILNPISQL